MAIGRKARSALSAISLAAGVGVAGIVGAIQAPSASATGRVVGTFVATSGRRAEVQIFMTKAFVMERDSKGDFHHAATLPARQPFSVFTPTDAKPVAAKTNSQGQFEFNGVQAGRYLLTVKKPMPVGPGESEYDNLYRGEAMAVFDLTAGHTHDAGQLSQKSR